MSLALWVGGQAGVGMMISHTEQSMGNGLMYVYFS